MLATLVIGLREGLEAALIVGIIAAFLRNNGKSLVAMWLGVALAVLLSVAVGVGLLLVEKSLPQATQEGLETIIGIVAVFFVTGMIVWMNTHARDLKRQLETQAANALGRTGSLALAGMAFLAVLKEGFETSVFLLATFSAAQSALLAAAGAVIGLLVAIVIGWGIYSGGVRFNLSKFFRYTGVFLLLVAAGLVLSSLRTAHEAGWINAGQQVVAHLGWLVAPGSIQSALVTGVLGIPADPRLIEVLGWLAYLIPVGLYLYWPQKRRPSPRAAVKLQAASGLIALLVAAALAFGYPQPHATVASQATLVSRDGNTVTPVGKITLTAPDQLTLQLGDAPPRTHSLAATQQQPHHRDGILADRWHLTGTHPLDQAPPTVSLMQLIAYSGGRIPVGISPSQNPGPFTAHWAQHYSTYVWLADNQLLDAQRFSMTTVTLSGGGLSSTRTLTIRTNNPVNAGSWRVATTHVDAAVSAINAAEAAATERHLWAVQLPLLLLLIAIILLLQAARGRHITSRPDTESAKQATLPPKPTTTGASHVV